MSSDTLDGMAGTGTAHDSTTLDAEYGSTQASGLQQRSGTAASWQDIFIFASTCKYGVVLREQQLLDALWGVDAAQPASA
jgi:hypothetical protein